MKNTNNTKERIVAAAWKLFYDEGFENTTVEEIVDLSGTSKGSFYHYFSSKDGLLSSLSLVFDEKYEQLTDTLADKGDAIEKLMYLNHELFLMIENSISVDLLARLLSSQLIAKNEKNLLDRNRTYYKLLRRIVRDGQSAGEIRADVTVNSIVKDYAMLERALMYDWCLCEGEYSLSQYAEKIMRPVLENLKKK